MAVSTKLPVHVGAVMTSAMAQLLGWLVRARLGAHRITLMYHSIVANDDTASGQDWLHLPISEFRAQLDWLTRHFTVVSPTRFFDPAPTEKPALLITFDDGYANNLLLAYPELAIRNLPALFFLSPRNLGGELFWWDRLRLTLAAIGIQAQPDDYQHFKSLHPFDLDARLTTWLEQHGAAALVHVPESLRTLTWHEARKFAHLPGVYIGSHADRHEILTQLTASEQATVLHRGRERLEAELKLSVQWLSPPNGGIDETVMKNAKEAGFSALFGVQPGRMKVAELIQNSERLVVVSRIGLGRSDTIAALAKRLLRASHAVQ